WNVTDNSLSSTTLASEEEISSLISEAAGVTIGGADGGETCSRDPVAGCEKLGATGRAFPDFGTAGLGTATDGERRGGGCEGRSLDFAGISSAADSDGAASSESSRASPRESRFSASARSSLSFSAMKITQNH